MLALLSLGENRMRKIGVDFDDKREFLGDKRYDVLWGTILLYSIDLILGIMRPLVNWAGPKR